MLHNKIRTLRGTIGVNSKEMAGKLGLHPVTYWQYENGKRNPPIWIWRIMNQMVNQN